MPCSNVRRRKTSWNLQAYPKLVNQSQPLVGRSSPYCGDMWTYCCLTSFFPIVDTCFSCKDIAQQSCAMVPRWQFLTVNVRPTNDVLLLQSDCRWCSWVAKVQMLLHSVLLVVCSLYLCCLIQLLRLEKLRRSISYRGRKLCADSGEDSRRSWVQILLCTLQYEPDCPIMWQFDSYCSVHRNIWIHDFCWHFFTFCSKSRWSVWQRSHFRQLWKIMKIGGQFAAWGQRTEAHVPTSCMVYACLYYTARWANEIVVMHCCHLSSGNEVKAGGDLF